MELVGTPSTVSASSALRWDSSSSSQTRSELQTSQPFPSRNSTRDEEQLAYKDDGSIELTFGPERPSEAPGNWIETVAGKSWYTILRLYGPLEPWFEKTWVPGNIERL
jgi:hypothetical protein